MTTLAIIQARFGASRLPGKVLLDLCGKTALERCVARARRIAGVDEVVVATSTEPKDELVAILAKRIGVRVFRGSELDVLSRYASVLETTKADVALRITADCPLLDPVHSAAVLHRLIESGADYASNVIERRLPRGLDTEAFRADALLRAARDATDALDREHVTRFVYRHPDHFRCVSIVSTEHDWSDQRWTLDTADDYHFLYLLHAALGADVEDAPVARIVDVVQTTPGLREINAHIQQKSS